MFVIIPTGTDAPIYHWPIMTGVTIAVNVIVFVLQLLNPDLTEMFCLEFGTFRPHTWLTAAYLHADFGHLFGNMVFLFTYGLVVEGKVGWWRFALIYNASAVVASILINVLSIFVVGSGLGASCAIFALMVICFLWAPENEVQFHWGGTFFFRVFGGAFYVSLQNVCFFFVALNFLMAAFTGFELSSAVFHLLGVIPGVLIGWGMLKIRQVNCDGHDFFSIRSGKKGQSQLTVSEEAEIKNERAERIAQRKQELESGLEAVDRYIEMGHYKNAFERFKSLSLSRPKLLLSEARLIKIVNGLEKNPEEDRLYRKLMKYYLKHYQRLAVPVRMKLAKRILEDEQPRAAIRILQPLLGPDSKYRLSQLQRKTIAKMQVAAKRLIAEGVIEVQMED